MNGGGGEPGAAQRKSSPPGPLLPLWQERASAPAGKVCGGAGGYPEDGNDISSRNPSGVGVSESCKLCVLAAGGHGPAAPVVGPAPAFSAGAHSDRAIFK